MELTLTEQEALELDDLLKQELETKFLSETKRKIITNIIEKLNN